MTESAVKSFKSTDCGESEKEKEVLEHDGTWLYFEITDGPVLAAIKAWENSVRDCHRKAQALREEIGASEEGVWKDNEHNIVGFSFDGTTPPKGWKHYVSDPEGMFRPDNTKAGKEWKKKMENLRPSGLNNVRSLLGRQRVLSSHSGSRTGFALISPSWKVYGDTYVAKVPYQENSYAVPEGLRPLSLSEHFQICQAHKEEK